MPNVLIVDDSSVDRHLFEGLLSKANDLNILQAANGLDALEKIRDWQIDVVVTDLQMPEMDGLALVKAIRRDFPNVPTILITGFGSEEIATQALNAGAASYVPKAKAAELLVSTVQGVLEILFAERSFDQLLSRATETRFEFILDNDPSYFAAIVDLCDNMLAGLSPLDRIERLRAGVAIEHALNNALYRGNLEIGPSRSIPVGNDEFPPELAELIDERKAQFPNRTIYVCVRIGTSDLACLIRDQGPGFASDVRPSLNGDGGRGLMLMHTFMDKIEFNHAGNEVILRRKWKKDKAESDEAELEELLKPASSALTLGIFSRVDSGFAVELLRPKVVVGRESSCHVVIDDEEVGAHHCQLNYRDGHWSFKAVGDQEVLHNNERAKDGRVMPGDRVRIGTHEYKIDYRTGNEGTP